MPTYIVTGPDGTKYRVSGPGTEQEALAHVQSQNSQPQPAAQPTVGVGEDMLRSGATGVRQGIESGLGSLSDAAHMNASGEGIIPKLLSIANPIGMIASGLPTTDQIHDVTKGVIGENYQPQTVPGEYARTGGQFLPAALAPGGVVRRIAQVALPALTSETAGQVTKGTPYEPYARLAGGLVGGLGASGNPAKALVKSVGKNAPSGPELKQQTDALFGSLRKAGIEYDANDFQKMASDLPTVLQKANVRPVGKLKEAFDWVKEVQKLSAAVDAPDGNNIPISSLLRSSSRINLAEADIAKGAIARATGPIQVSRVPDGRLLVVDGYHRLVEAMQAGSTNIAVDHIPWTDTFSRVMAKERGGFIDPAKAPDFDDIQSLRSAIGEASRDAGRLPDGKQLARALDIVGDQLNDFEANAPLVMRGRTPTPAQRDTLNKVRTLARNTALRNIKNRTLDRIVKDADTYAGGREAGIRQGLRNIAKSKNKEGQAFTDAERTVLLDVANGRKAINALSRFGIDLRRVASSATVGPTVAAGAVGTGFGALPGLGLLAAGSIARPLSGIMTNKALERAAAAVRSGKLSGPKAQEELRRLQGVKRARLFLSGAQARPPVE